VSGKVSLDRYRSELAEDLVRGHELRAWTLPAACASESIKHLILDVPRKELLSCCEPALSDEIHAAVHPG
jgi:hypothetical protein